MDPLFGAFIMAACLLVEGFFSGSEIAVVSADKILLRHKAASGSRGAKLALTMLEKPEWLLSTTLVGTNIAVVTNTTVATGLVIVMFGPENSWLAIAVAAPLIWVFGEIVPKSVFQQKADAITPWIIFPLRVASVVFWPLLIVFTLITKFLARLAGNATERNPFTLREEISTMMQMAPKESDILPQEQSMISRVFKFSEVEAEEIMVPLIDVVGIEKDVTCGEAIRVAVDRAHKLLPVYDERVDRIIGTVNSLELLARDPRTSVREFVRDPLYVPGNKSARSLLTEMRENVTHLAVVVDEFGGADGIVTLEDILEEVVGELEDEFDDTGTETAYRMLENGTYMVKGRADIEELNEDLGIALPEGEYETLAGFLLKLNADIPECGEVIKHGPYTFRIERATERLIEEVRITW